MRNAAGHSVHMPGGVRTTKGLELIQSFSRMTGLVQDFDLITPTARHASSEVRAFDLQITAIGETEVGLALTSAICRYSAA